MARSPAVSIAVGLATFGILSAALWPAAQGELSQSDSQVAAQDAQQPATKKQTGKGKQNKNKAKQTSTGNAPQGSATKMPSAAELGVPVLSSGDSYDDFVSVAEGPDGSLYAAYAAYFDGHDQIRLHKRLPGGNWSTHSFVPLVEARPDIWMPQIAVDAQNRLWVIWCEQTERTRTESGNWDIYARMRVGDGWGPLVRLTRDPKPDINPHVVVDAKHGIHVVWQAHGDNNGDIMLCRFNGESWSKPLAVTNTPASDWYPRVAVDNEGTEWVAFDSYRNGDYDVFLTSVQGDRVGPIVPIATSPYYEAHASVACTPDGRVWIAWEQGGHNWGKDQGYWLRHTGRQAGGAKTAEELLHPSGGGAGTTLGSTREVKVACWHAGKLLAAPQLPIPEGDPVRFETAMAGLTVDVDGRVWLRYRRMVRGAPRPRGGFSRAWAETVAHLSGEGWSKPVTLAGSEGRISVFNRAIASAAGGLIVGYSSDQRKPENYHQPIHDRALATTLQRPESPAGAPELSAYTAPGMPAGYEEWNVDRERQQVSAIRQARTEVAGQSLRVVRGDLHRHTELSWDVGPGNDGSFLDFYRYMIDVAEMDFGGLTDHQGGGHYAYHWWLTEKSNDLYYLAPRFVPLYGYERSARFPDGHRNVFHAYRGVPVFPFQTRLNLTGVFPGVGTGDLVSNDTKLLYEFLHRTGGVAISHTSGTDTMGTDWRDNDPLVEPVVEIYQGARNNYEALGAPRVHDIANLKPAEAPGGFQAAGMVWNAYEKGYRLGITASSDHGSTHISYSLVYVSENKREPIMEAIQRRHTYGATDNLIVESRANGHFMGEEFQTTDKPALELKVRGTGKIARIDLVRNNNYIYSTAPNKTDVSLRYIDQEPKTGLNYYYFRIQQDDGELAWASPVWINVK